jgi:DNA-binding transcriptional regulator YiaG
VTDPELIQAAIDAASLSARRFAVEVLGVDERTVRRWQLGERALSAPLRKVCALIVARPAVAAELARIAP